MPTMVADQHPESERGSDWSREEVEAIVADYFQMLALFMAGQAFNKSAHRRTLALKLSGRSSSSIEFKHGNISAVLDKLGFPYLPGYRPRGNFQGLLAEVVAGRLRKDAFIDKIALAAVEQPAVTPEHIDFARTKTDAPLRQEMAQFELPPSFKAVKRDYLEREAANQSLGSAGEEFVLRFEHWRLVASGYEELAERVEHVSKTQGDGLGFDILSFNLDGSERFIEVKTTTFGRETPFFLSDRELVRSRVSKDDFHLYRVFEFRKQPRLFDLPGPLDTKCHLDPITYRARFA